MSKAPNYVSIANRLRSVALMLRMGRADGGTLEVVDGIVAELDAWEEHLAKPRPIVHGPGSKNERRRRGR